jgi:hypothetical protein
VPCKLYGDRPSSHQTMADVPTEEPGGVHDPFHLGVCVSLPRGAAPRLESPRRRRGDTRRAARARRPGTRRDVAVREMIVPFTSLSHARHRSLTRHLLANRLRASGASRPCKGGYCASYRCPLHDRSDCASCRHTRRRCFGGRIGAHEGRRPCMGIACRAACSCQADPCTAACMRGHS